MFHQLYSVHVKLEDSNAVPVMFALLPGQDSASYRTLVEIISRAIDGFHPQALHVDFEKTMIKELEREFPSAGIVGCNFHFNQCLHRHVQADADLRKACSDSLDFALRMKMFAALAYVPVGDVRSCFETLLSSSFVVKNAELLKEFINYMESTWVGRERNPHRVVECAR